MIGIVYLVLSCFCHKLFFHLGIEGGLSRNATDQGKGSDKNRHRGFKKGRE
jgi:hypothetical protein